MKNFTCVQDIGNLKTALAEAFEIKKDRFKYVELGRNKTLMMIFFNSSLRTRLSTQKAALNLGMNVIVLDINQGAWKLETERGVIMDGDKPEHLLEAIPVMGCYCDIIGVRSFARFENRDYDYNEVILNQFIQYSGRPVFSMEAATRHPLQSFADLITIEEYKKKERPKVVMSWAPHPRPLPQAVPNSFAEWMNATDYEFVITHPEGYELDPKFVGNARVEYDQMKAFEGADFVYAKNWAAYSGDNYGQILSKDRAWTVSDRQMAVTNNAYFMHCLPVRRNMIVTDDGPFILSMRRRGLSERVANRFGHFCKLFSRKLQLGIGEKHIFLALHRNQMNMSMRHFQTQDSHSNLLTRKSLSDSQCYLLGKNVHSGQLFIFQIKDIVYLTFRNDQRMSFYQRIDVQKCEELLVLRNFITGNFACYNSTEYGCHNDNILKKQGKPQHMACLTV